MQLQTQRDSEHLRRAYNDTGTATFVGQFGSRQHALRNGTMLPIMKLVNSLPRVLTSRGSSSNARVSASVSPMAEAASVVRFNPPALQEAAAAVFGVAIVTAQVDCAAANKHARNWRRQRQVLAAGDCKSAHGTRSSQQEIDAFPSQK